MFDTMDRLQLNNELIIDLCLPALYTESVSLRNPRKNELIVMNTTICENIKKLRKQKNVTQEKLAESLGVTPQAISRWESGAGFPAIDYLPDLAGYFEVSVDELLGVKLSKREARREELYAMIDRINAENGYNDAPGAVEMLREAHAEFPGDMKISFALAWKLCYERYK